MKNKIITTDIYLTAALLAIGCKLDGTDKADERHMKFTVIPNQPEFVSENLPSKPIGTYLPVDLEYYEREWANGTLMINAVAFKDAIQRMKSVIHSR